RINHHKNCMLCHAPGSLDNEAGSFQPPVSKDIEDKKQPTKVVKEVTTPDGKQQVIEMVDVLVRTEVGLQPAQVPVPGQPLPTPSQGYGFNPHPDLLVRIDVTYLRQDFSMLQPVLDANHWPGMQRFDFLVRTRKMSKEEVEEFATKLEPRSGEPNPYQRL